LFHLLESASEEHVANIYAFMANITANTFKKFQLLNNLMSN